MRTQRSAAARALAISISLAALGCAGVATIDDEAALPGGAALFSSDSAQYAFDNGVQGWQSNGKPIAVGQGRRHVYAGSGSLLTAFDGSAGTADVFVANPSTPAGSRVDFHVYCPSTGGINWIQPYALEGQAANWRFTGTYKDAGALTFDGWNTISVQLPATSTPLAQLGVQFNTRASGAFRCYVDSVSWGGGSSPSPDMGSTGGGGGGGTGGAGGSGGAGGAGGSGGSGGTGGSGGSGGGGPATGQWVLGYYVAYNSSRYPIASIDWSALTHIILAPLDVNADGTINTTFTQFSQTDGANFARQLSSAAHAHGVKTLLMLGGAGLSDNVKPAMSNLGQLVQRLLSTMTDLGCDGIDLDVEASNFSLDDAITLAAALRSASPGIVLTFPGGTVQYGQKVDPRIVTLATHLDRYNMQSYMGGNAGMFTGGDGNGGRFQSWFYGALGDIAADRPYSIDYALAQLAAAGVPKAKLGMGIAFYAACYRIPDTTPAGGQDISAPRMPTNAGSDWCWDCGVGGGDNSSSYNFFYSGTGVLATSSAAEQKWDSAASEPYLSFAAAKSVDWCGGSTRFITYEDEQSIKAKGSFSRANGYGGTIIWTIDQGWLPPNAAGGRAQNALMQALHDGFLAP